MAGDALRLGTVMLPRVVREDQLAADFRDPAGHVLSILGPRRGGR